MLDVPLKVHQPGRVPEALGKGVAIDLELCYLSPVKQHGCALSFTGGVSLQLKGTLIMYRAKERSIVRATSQLESLGLCQHVVVLVGGNMTHSQQEKAKVKARIRPDKIMKAIEWLVENHPKWQDVDLDGIR